MIWGIRSILIALFVYLSDGATNHTYIWTTQEFNDFSDSC
jgi:hypothetical protein